MRKYPRELIFSHSTFKQGQRKISDKLSLALIMKKIGLLMQEHGQFPNPDGATRLPVGKHSEIQDAI